MKCKVCGKRFKLQIENKYIATESVSPLSALASPAKSYECFDCPSCGCQNFVNIRMNRLKQINEG